MRNILFVSILLTTVIACQPKQEHETINSSGEPPIAESNEENSPLSQIVLMDLDGKAIDLQDHQGKPIFLNFWATWCRPCVAEMPSIVRAQEQLDQSDYVFLLASDESVKKITRFKDLQDFPLKFVKLESGFMNLGITSIPTTLIIDRKGEIVMDHVGALNWDSPDMIEKLRGFAQTGG
ncbi:MAG: TlpA family protein disulfide reductase [Cyclobacteriaceae bacterium]